MVAVTWNLLLAGGVLLVLWLLHSAYRPYARCVMCKGSPRNSSSTGRTWRNCWWCGGSGRRTRLGKKLIDNAMARRR